MPTRAEYMPHPASGRRVVRTVPAVRAYAAVFTLVALLGFAFTIAFAHDRIAAIITSVPMTAFYSGAMILILRRFSEGIVAPPRRITAYQLPPAVGIWKGIATYVVLVLIMGAAFVAWSLVMDEYLAIGILLGSPLITWDGVRRAKRTEYDENGILWMTTGFAWTSKSRTRYLVAGE